MSSIRLFQKLAQIEKKHKKTQLTGFGRKIARVSDGREMGFAYSDGKLVLHIDRLDLYEMFDIQI